MLSSKKEQDFEIHSNLDKFRTHYAEWKKHVSKAYLLNASVIWHTGKDKIMVMENTVVARGSGWREEVTIKDIA